MKLKHISIALAAAAAFLLPSCSDNDYTELDKGSAELALSASKASVVLDEKDHATEALALSWTTGTNHGTGNRISYTLELAEAGTGFAAPCIIKDAQQQVYDWKPSVAELNEIALNRFGTEPGQTITLDARVTAVVTGLDDVQTAETSFSITPYEPVSETLFLIGDATPNGWSADNATVMNRSDNGVFTWTGNLTPGSFKFITTLGQFLPSYNNNGDGQLVYRTSDDQPDLQFSVTEAHCYKIDVNLLDLTVSCRQTEGVTPPYDHLYFVGNETDWGFRPMSQDPLDPFLFRIGVFFTKGGEFKFGTADGSWENMYKAANANAPYTDPEVEFIKGFDPDNKWVLAQSETNLAYKICLDIRPGAERMLMRLFTPYTEMFMVGDATPNGWDLGNATPMTQNAADPNIFTWSGRLNTGEMKFSPDKQDDWNGAWFMAASEGEAPTGATQKVIFINKSDDTCQEQYNDISVGSVDLKWRITEAGNYTITLNQLLEEVTIVRN